MDGRVLIDGGACNPLPFDNVMECDITVACDVTGGPPRVSEKMPGLLECVVGAAQISMQSVIREKLKWHQPDVLVRPEINGVFILDFLKTQAILEANVGFKDDLKRRLDHVINTPFELPADLIAGRERSGEEGPRPRSRRYRNKPLAHGGRWARQRSGRRGRPRRPWGRRRRSRAGGCGRRRSRPRIRCRAPASRRDRSRSSRSLPEPLRRGADASTSACAVTSLQLARAVAAGGDDLAAAHQNGADRNLAALARGLRLAQAPAP